MPQYCTAKSSHKLNTLLYVLENLMACSHNFLRHPRLQRKIYVLTTIFFKWGMHMPYPGLRAVCQAYERWAYGLHCTIFFLNSEQKLQPAWSHCNLYPVTLYTSATVPYTLYPLYLCSTKYFRVAPKPIAFPCTPWLLQVPAASVSGNSKAEKEAFKGAWPSARQLLCHFHILQAEWRWPTAANIQVMQDQRCPIKAAFQKVLTQYAI